MRLPRCSIQKRLETCTSRLEGMADLRRTPSAAAAPPLVSPRPQVDPKRAQMKQRQRQEAQQVCGSLVPHAASHPPRRLRPGAWRTGDAGGRSCAAPVVDRRSPASLASCCFCVLRRPVLAEAGHLLGSVHTEFRLSSTVAGRGTRHPAKGVGGLGDGRLRNGVWGSGVTVYAQPWVFKGWDWLGLKGFNGGSRELTTFWGD